jgi:hypothetical protein
MMISDQRMMGSGAGDATIRLLADRATNPGKIEVIKCLASIVNDGLAQWANLANGDVELTLLSGETFHLGQTTITRIG